MYYSFFTTDLQLLVSFGALALGVLNLISFVTLDKRVRDMEEDQDSICSTVCKICSGWEPILGLADNCASILNIQFQQFNIFLFLSFQTKAIGNLALSTTVADNTKPSAAEFLAVVNTLNGIATPDC